MKHLQILCMLLVLAVLVAFPLARTSFAAADTTLSFSPSDTTPSVGDQFSVNVNINTGVNAVIGVELHLSFPVSKLKAISVAKGSFFTSADPVGPTISNTLGTIDYSLLVPPSGSGKSGTGTVAVITFEALGSGSASISFDSDTLVAATGESGQNVLESSPSTTLTIGASASTSSGSSQASTSSSSSSGSNSSSGGSGATLPDAGTIWPTILLISVGAFFLGGSVLWYYRAG